MTDKATMAMALEALELVNIEFVCNGAHHAKKDRHGLDEDCPVTMRYRKAITALKERLAQSEQEPVVDLHFFKQVLSVAIAGLYEHYKEDVINTFSIEELSDVVDLSESLQPRRVEDIYKQMWVMLSTPPAQRTEQNFCPRCGKRTNDIHTCTPPKENT